MRIALAHRKDTFLPVLKENIKVALDEDVTDKVWEYFCLI